MRGDHDGEGEVRAPWSPNTALSTTTATAAPALAPPPAIDAIGAIESSSDGVPSGIWNEDADAHSAERNQPLPPPGKGSVDDELLLAWRAGDLQSGQRLWRCHLESVQRFFRNKVPWAVALDLSQRTVEACLRAQDRIRSFRSYVLGVATKQLFEYLRTERRKQRHDVDLETMILDDSVDGPEEWMGAKREKRVLLRALRRLPLPLQLVLELRYWEQLSDRDIAEVLGWPAGTVKTRISTGKRALRVQIERLGASPDQLRSTVDSFDQWAARTRQLMPAESPLTDGTPETLAPGGALAEGSIPMAPSRAARGKTR